MSDDGLRELEHLVLLAISRLEPPAHGVPIVKELMDTVSRSISRASVYVVLRRLEAKGLVRSTMGDPTPERGGRAKRLYTLTPLAVRSLKAAQQNFTRLWAGSRVLGVLLVVLLGGNSLSAQSRPNLTGTWLNVSDPNATDVTVASTLPFALLTILHQGDRVELRTSGFKEPSDEAHSCDGRINTNRYAKGVVVERTTCSWNADGGLVVEGTIGPGHGVEGLLRYTYSLDTNDILVVNRMRQITQSSAGPHTPLAWVSRYKRVLTR